MEKILNYVNGEWISSGAKEYADVINPATAELLAKTPLGGAEEVDKAVLCAAQVFKEWRRVPVLERVKPLFKLRELLIENFDDLARTITMECGKTFEEARGEMLRAVENVAMATAMPIMMQGYNNEDISAGIDEMMIRQPLGVGTTIAPFNFPAMITFWFMPYALATGNTFLVKPSERVSITMQKIFRLIDQSGFPKGVVNMVNGAKPAVDAILNHPGVRAVTFVGSTPVAKYIYSQASASGKRVQAQGGAKNPTVIMPDADMDTSIKIIADSAFGSAGQRCLATSVIITVGGAREPFTEMILNVASNRVVGYGLDNGVEMGPVISAQSKQRIEGLIGGSAAEGARILVDGRDSKISGYENGYFVRPTVVTDVNPKSELAFSEVFGPVLGLMHVETLDEAIKLVNDRNYGNMANIFTRDGGAARKFRYEVEAGNVGVNIGVAAPMAFFPFSGWKDSFFGDMHGQGMDAVEFFTQKKVVIERWPKEWSRKF
ncbi:MAG: methylmalonate-semialdehyde dehydrogenase (acylating) [Chloroflexi bacterium GWB2_49_20]|nr:MAG: methylmalonate-semialdehyde dehydrogenase (acylating) [Chloroflexi bacterium GWB2_49_20]OGN78155.1 MAG: methylmalonate-semialdehyde dehydrogenase (acylating) [Chloroflexi bacterium GWC2_49_37]OGN85191.1 MAG: methylmalonate-semialdehyde dehydrogenase (acylating) [Chloroflexi bacterium GWD2_49_16]